MGIKDNFSQAVKELWKKDSEQQENAPRQEKSTELDRYLRQEPERANSSDEQTAAPEQSESVSPVQENEDNAAKQTVQSGEENAFSASEGLKTGFDNAENNNPNRNVQNIRRNPGQNNQNSFAQGGYNDSYNQNYGRPSGNFGQSGNGFVPPSQGGIPMQENNEPEEVTVISKDTSIDGNVRSLANMQIDGNIRGNVETTRDVDINGKIIGDIICNNAGMNAAAMQGNVSLKGKIRMDRDTILIGDLSSQYADINGRIRGKLDIAGKAELKRDAIIFGDINASTIAVTDGAIIQGYVNTTFLSKEDSRNVFPDAISIDTK